MEKNLDSAALKVGQLLLDPATERVGVLMALLPAARLHYDTGVRGPLVAFLRPERGGREWTADPAALRGVGEGGA
ncbi:hypothetical protein GCM10027168_36040 [Streptomyces capparidis]